MPKRKPKPSKPAREVREVMSEADAARACASMFVRAGIPEGRAPGEFEITDVTTDDDGEWYAVIKVPVSNLDIEWATKGEHLDQDKLNAIHAEPRDEE